MVTLLHHFVLWSFFTQVEQKFLCSGHSFLPCDRNFALIEKQKHVRRILHPFEWVELIANARSSKPFLVKLMEQSDFLDMSLLEKKTLKPKEFKVTEAMWLLFKKDDPKSLYTRKSHSVLIPWNMYTIRKSISSLTRPEDLPSLYTSKIPVKAEKKANLVDMCKYIEDQKARDFFLTFQLKKNRYSENFYLIKLFFFICILEKCFDVIRITYSFVYHYYLFFPFFYLRYYIIYFFRETFHYYYHYFYYYRLET